MLQRKTLLVLGLGVSALSIGAIIQAVIPQVVPTANKIGNSTKFQLGIAGAISGDCASFDANLNVTGPGTGAGCAGAAANSGGLTVYSGTAGISLSGTTFFPIGGGSGASTTETAVDADVQASTTISKFGANLSTALGMSNSVVFTWRKNMSSQTLTCTISGAVATSCADSTNSFSVVPGDLVDIQAVFSGTIVVAPTFVLTAQVGSILSGSVNTGTAGQFGYYASNGSAISSATGMTTHGVVLYEGTSAPASTAPGTTGQCFLSNGGSADPAFTTCPASGSGTTPFSFPGIITTLTLPVLTDFTAFTTPANTATTTDTGKGITITGANVTFSSFFTTSTANAGGIAAFWGFIGPEDFGQEGMLCRESSTNKSISYVYQHNSGVGGNTGILTIGKVNADGSFSAAYKQSVMMQVPTPGLIFLKLQNTGGNRVASISPDGVNYTTFFSVTSSDFATCNQWGFNAGGSANWPPNFRLVHWANL